MRKYLFYIILVLCGGLAGCNKSAERTAPPKALSFTASIGGYQSKATDTAFEDGDRIGLFSMTGQDVYNLGLTAQGTQLLPDSPVEVYPGSGDALLFRAYYPYSPDRDFYGYYEDMVSPDQSTHELYTASDLIIGEGNGSTSGDCDIHLVFQHVLSNIVIIPSSFEPIAELYLTDVLGKYQYSISDNWANGIGNTGTIKTGKVTFRGSEAFTAIVPPQGTCPRLLVVTASGAQYEYDLSFDIYMNRGCRTVAYVEITENSTTADISQEIEAWIDDPYGTFEREEIHEPEYFVYGPATGIEGMSWDCSMSQCFNDADNYYRVGMYEKFIVLQEGEEFCIIQDINGDQILIGAELMPFEPYSGNEAFADNPPLVYKGSLIAGDDVPMMTVPQTGLYHIVFDLNVDGALDYSGGGKVVVAYAGDMCIRGDFNTWTCTPMECDGYSNTETVFYLQDLKATKGDAFKFAYGNAWRVTIDDMGYSKALTCFGENFVHQAYNITMPTSGILDVYVYFHLTGGSPENSFFYQIVKTGENIQYPSMFIVGLSGTGLENGWSDPSGSSLAYFVEEESNIEDETVNAGSFVYRIDSIEIPADAFKIRYNGMWIGVGECEVRGIEYTNDNDGNFVCLTPGTYCVTFNTYWDGDGLSSLIVTFEAVD